MNVKSRCVRAAVYSSHIALNTEVPSANFHQIFPNAVLMCALLQGKEINFMSLCKGGSRGSQGSIISAVKRVQAG
jgi:hypothetical protein